MKSDPLHPSSLILHTFFQKFDQFTDAPNAVAKLREMVRTLAVQGKLVPQDSKHEPAKDLIRRVSAGLPKKQSKNPLLAGTEPSIKDESNYDLPSGWAWLPLGNAGIWATGCGFPMHFQGETEGEFLFCKVSDMNLPGNEVEIHTTVNSIDADVMKKIRARSNPIGTVIFPKIGGAIATHKRRLVIKPTIIDNNCSGIQPIGLTDNRWLLLLMRSMDLTRYQSGTSVPAVSQGALDPIRIGLPPLAEQKRIVAKVDELMALCDRLEAQQQERETRHAALARASLARFADAPTPANLPFLFHPSYPIPPADLRKSILTLAVQGKLVPQNPNDEPAETLLAQMAESKARLIREKKVDETHRLHLAAKNDPPDWQPDGWVWKRFWDVIWCFRGHNPPKSAFVTEPRPGYVRFIQITDFKTDSRAVYVPESRQNKMVYKDEIIMAAYRHIGKLSRRMEGAFNVALCKVTEIRPMSRDFVGFLIGTDLVKGELLAASERAHIPSMHSDHLLSLWVPVPPLAEQRRIVAKVDQLTALVDQLETQLAASGATAANLLEALVAELAANP